VSIADYLHELREKLAAVNTYANEQLAREQKRWVGRYNLRSRDKKFTEDETVMILQPDSTTSRLWSRWRALASTVSELGDYSLVEYNGARPIVHANKLRQYDIRVNVLQCKLLMFIDVGTGHGVCADVNACSIVYEEDTQFDLITFRRDRAPYTVLWSVVVKYRKWPFSAPRRTKTPHRSKQ
jgi:hypothetical protein